MELTFDRKKSLEELEGAVSGEPDYDSYLVSTIHRLRRKPLNEFSVEDLRIMIGQQIGLRYLVPLAIKSRSRVMRQWTEI
jgi:CDI immunity proteins